MAVIAKISFISRFLFLVTPISLLMFGCQFLDEPPSLLDVPATVGSPGDIITDPAGVEGLLLFLNAPRTTLPVLDYDARLDRRAAQAIIDHRDGQDSQYGTADDNYFDSLSEILAVSWVGDQAVNQILEYARETGWITEDHELAGIFEGVAFSFEQAEASIELVNTATFEFLVNSVGLDDRAAESIVLAQPLKSIDQLADLYYVGTATLLTIRDFEPAGD